MSEEPRALLREVVSESQLEVITHNLPFKLGVLHDDAVGAEAVLET